MKGVITVPQNIITGAFTILMTFIRPIELTAADVVTTTLAGDALGHTKDSFGGSGASYHRLCYLPDARCGKSRISISKPGVDVAPVIVAYDTVKTVHATWGPPLQRNRKIEIPVSFDVAIQHLKKRNFKLSPPLPFQVYGSDDAYSLVVPDSGHLTVTVSGTVRKSNGVRAGIPATVLEV